MATPTESIPDVEIGTAPDNWIAGGIVGLIAGGVCGGILAHSPMVETLAALVTLEGQAAGWAVHFLISALLGVLFTGLVTVGSLPEYASQVSTGAGLGIVYGVGVWVVGVVIIMPLWLNVVTPTTPSVPNLDWLSLAGLFVYGIIVGTLYPVLLAHD